MKSFLGGGGVASVVLVLVAVSAFINVANGLSCFERECGGKDLVEKCPQWDVDVTKKACKDHQKSCTAVHVTFDASAKKNPLELRGCYTEEEIKNRYSLKDVTVDCNEFSVTTPTGDKGKGKICMCDKDFCNGKEHGTGHSGAGRLDSLSALPLLGLVGLGLLALTSTWGLLGGGAGPNHS